MLIMPLYYDVVVVIFVTVTHKQLILPANTNTTAGLPNRIAS